MRNKKNKEVVDDSSSREAMEKFESDLAAGKDVTIEEYIQIGQTNYSNAVSKTGYKIGTLIEKFMNTGIQKVLKVLEKLF